MSGVHCWASIAATCLHSCLLVACDDSLPQVSVASCCWWLPAAEGPLLVVVACCYCLPAACGCLLLLY